MALLLRSLQGSQTVEVDQGTNTDCRFANNAIVQQASYKATEMRGKEGGWLDASRHSIRQVEIALQVESARGGVDVQRKGSQEAKAAQNADQKQTRGKPRPAYVADRVVLRDTCRNVSPGDCGF